jgi:N utilization substance protein B
VVKEQHPHSVAREWAVQFLYQCEIEKLYFFSEAHLDRFIQDFEVPATLCEFMRSLVEGVFSNLSALNETIEGLSEHWNLSRMPIVDRCVLRMAAFEILYLDTPKRVVINEAIELVKKYSTEHSGSFVNGILDRLQRPAST